MLKSIHTTAVSNPETDQDIINQGRQAALEGKHITEHPFQDAKSYGHTLWIRGFREVCIHQER